LSVNLAGALYSPKTDPKARPGLLMVYPVRRHENVNCLRSERPVTQLYNGFGSAFFTIS